MELVEEIYSIFEQDPEINELGIILSNDLPHILHIEHKIGLSMAILKPLFLYTITNLAQSHSLMLTNDNNKYLEKISLCALLVKGDFPPAFIVRKKLIQQYFLSPELELNYLQVILSKHSKSPSCWHHRRWCIEFLQRSNPSFDIRQLWSKELLLCSRMCDIYPRNYYAWNYRLWISEHLDHNELSVEVRDGFAWMKKHVSDHSAVNYIQQVIIRLLKTSDLSFQIHLLNEIDLESIKFVAASAGHESLWYQRRLFSKTFLIWISQNVWILENSEQNDFAENSSHFATSINSFLSMIQEYSITNNLHQFLSEDYDVTQDLNSQNNFFQNIQNILKSANLQQDNQHSFTIRNQQIIVAYIHKYLSLELDLVLGLLTDDMSWNPQLQLKYSLRYLYYLLHLAIKLLIHLTKPTTSYQEFAKVCDFISHESIDQDNSFISASEADPIFSLLHEVLKKVRDVVGGNISL